MPYDDDSGSKDRGRGEEVAPYSILLVQGESDTWRKGCKDRRVRNYNGLMRIERIERIERIQRIG